MALASCTRREGANLPVKRYIVTRYNRRGTLGRGRHFYAECLSSALYPRGGDGEGPGQSGARRSPEFFQGPLFSAQDAGFALTRDRVRRPNYFYFFAEFSALQGGDPGNAILLNGDQHTANREIGVPGVQPQASISISVFNFSWQEIRPKVQTSRGGLCFTAGGA
jgi:hypothetical protein